MAENENTPSEREQRLDAAIAEYYQALEIGQPLDREAFLAQHADLADELASFLADMAAFERQAGAGLRSEQNGPLPEPPATIRYFGDYELLDEIARGGMGVVFRARQISLNRTVALKM